MMNRCGIKKNYMGKKEDGNSIEKEDGN